jgi:hypothetical protein
MAKRLSDETIAKMRSVVAAVLAEPEFYSQSLYPQPGNCGRICCAAGWAVWINNPERYFSLIERTYSVDWNREAEEVLGLGDTGYKLFVFAATWPDQFRRMYYDAETHKQQAEAMAARWEFYIQTDGTDKLPS